MTRVVSAKKINGNLLSNTIIGNHKSNRIYGGFGADGITTGLGRDVLVYESVLDSGPSPLTRDIITDFEAGTAQEGVDRLNLRKLGKGFTYIGSNEFSGISGQVRFADGLVSADTNGDGMADFAVLLQNNGESINQFYRSNLILH